MSDPHPLIAVVGPTASGKTSLGEVLAQELRGEIISADSRQVYRGLNLGTGKETLTVAQHLVDICEPEESFSAAEWKERAEQVIEKLVQRDLLPVVVGGTGLYISSLLENFTFGPPAEPERRAEIASWSTEKLVDYLEQENRPALDRLDVRNRRYLERAVEKTQAGWRATARRQGSYPCLILMPDWPREELYQRIDKRLRQRMEDGMLEEVQGLLESGVSPDWLRGLGLEYRYLTDYLDGRYVSLDEALEKLSFAIHHYARRQLGWWRRSSLKPVMVPRGDHSQAISLSRSFLDRR